MADKGWTIMKIPKSLLEELKILKVHPRQPNYEVVEKLLREDMKLKYLDRKVS